MKNIKSDVQRIEEIIAEANAFIDKRAEEIAKRCPGVPLAMIRQTIIGGRCACAGALHVSAEIEKEVA